MANAKRCDRCLNYFDETRKADEMVRIRTINYEGNVINGYDVCPNCRISFINWLTVEPKIVQA